MPCGSNLKIIFENKTTLKYLAFSTLFLCVFRCTKSGLKEIQCPSGLAFDIMKQTCDWKAKVTNCNEKESKWLSFTFLKTKTKTNKTKQT